MDTVKLIDIVTRETYDLTTHHSASSYNQPVLVDSDGCAYGPRDMILDRFGELRQVADWVSDSLELADPSQQDCDMIKRWNRL